jgi:hypothetical protein
MQKSIFAERGVIPAVSGGPSNVEGGNVFRSHVYGRVLGAYIYLMSGASGTGWIGNLWNSSGVKLNTVSFPVISVVGWNYAEFSKPTNIIPGTAYCISVSIPTTTFGQTISVFVSDVLNYPLIALSSAHAVSAGFGGNLISGPVGTFPTNPSGSNYWFGCDLLFESSVRRRRR